MPSEKDALLVKKFLWKRVLAACPPFQLHNFENSHRLQACHKNILKSEINRAFKRLPPLLTLIVVNQY